MNPFIIVSPECCLRRSALSFFPQSVRGGIPTRSAGETKKGGCGMGGLKAA